MTFIIQICKFTRLSSAFCDILTTDEPFEMLCTKVRAIYERRPEVQTDCWPPVQQSSFINVALLKNDKFPYFDEDTRQTVQKTMDDIYEKKENISFEQLFSDIEPGARLLIEGRPGSGKTTLMNKVSSEWAKGKILRNVELLLHVPLRKFYNNASLDVTDIVTLFDSKVVHTSAHLGSLLNTGEGVCIVLDGIDEYRHSSDCNNLVSELMHCRSLPNAVVIAASRPAASQCFRGSATKRAEVLGFLRPQITDYVKQHYKSNEQKAIQLLTYLHNHQNIHRMCYLPLHLAMIVYLNDILGARDQSDLMPKLETEVYLRFTIHTLLRDQHKENTDVRNLAKPEDLPPQKLGTFRRICALAYQQTLSSQPIFTRNDAKEIITEGIKLESLGLLTVDQQFMENGVEETYSFLHLTFQEFLGAWHISQLPDQQVLDCCKECGDLPHMSVVWRFFCGITKLEKDHELEAFGRLVNPESKANTMRLLHYSYESQSKDSAKLLVSLTGGRISVTDEIMVATDSIALSFVLNNCGDDLKKLDISSCQLDVEEVKILVENTEELPGVKSLR